MCGVQLVFIMQTLNIDLNKYCAYNYVEDIRIEILLSGKRAAGVLNDEANLHLP